MTPATAVHRKTVALVVEAVLAIGLLSRRPTRIALMGLRLLAARLLAAAGDEGGQPVDMAVVGAVVALAALLLLRAAPIGLLARGEELGIARQEGLRVARAERGLLARLRRLGRFFVVAVVELFVMRVVAGERIVPGAAFRPVEIRRVLPELLVHCRDQAEIMLGMLIIVFRRHRVAGGLRIAGELNVFFSDVRRRSANLDVRTVRFVNPR
jgi:hypothetical protein